MTWNYLGVFNFVPQYSRCNLHTCRTYVYFDICLVQHALVKPNVRGLEEDDTGEPPEEPEGMYLSYYLIRTL